jgi:hypothetical protein
VLVRKRDPIEYARGDNGQYLASFRSPKEQIMDGETFDRLSVQIQRLRDQATRRGALRVLLGGSLAAVGGFFGKEAAAKNKRRRNKYSRCRGYAAFCDSHHDCCTNNCINNRCFPGHGGGGGRNCNGINCPNGWSCRRNGNVSVCVPNNFNNCCGGYCYGSSFNCCNNFYGAGACPFGWDCCGGFNQCCGENQFCCGNGQCCPDGWYCGNIACYANQNAAIASDSSTSRPFIAPVTIGESQYYKLPDQ